MSHDRERVVAIARSWIGTPYRDAHSAKGIGADCLGLLRGVWRELFGHEPEEPPKYGPGWFEVGTRELMLEAAGRYLVPVQGLEVRAGDVLMFRMHPDALVKHCGIATGADSFVHAYRRNRGQGVVENSLTRNWMDLLHSRHSFPGVM